MHSRTLIITSMLASAALASDPLCLQGCCGMKLQLSSAASLALSSLGSVSSIGGLAPGIHVPLPGLSEIQCCPCPEPEPEHEAKIAASMVHEVQPLAAKLGEELQRNQTVAGYQQPILPTCNDTAPRLIAICSPGQDPHNDIDCIPADSSVHGISGHRPTNQQITVIVCPRGKCYPDCVCASTAGLVKSMVDALKEIGQVHGMVDEGAGVVADGGSAHQVPLRNEL